MDTLDNLDLSMPEGEDLPAAYIPKYFKETEFMMATPSCSLKQMDEYFMKMLDDARELAGVPFHVNSAYRSKDWEILHGRTATSSHCKGIAIDIHCLDSWHRSCIVCALVRVGFKRIGIYKRFIHVDWDASKPDSIWIDGDWSNTKKDA